MAWFVGLGMMAVVTALVDVTRGAWGMNVPPLYEAITARDQVYIMLGLLVFIYLVLHTVVHSNVGLAFRGIGQNFDTARASGINPTRYKVLNFTLSCALAGLLGGFYGPYVGILTPSVMGTSYTIEILTLCYVGGRATLWGGLLASFIFIPVFDYLKKLMELRLIIYGVALISVMIFYPAGMAGLNRQTLVLAADKNQRSLKGMKTANSLSFNAPQFAVLSDSQMEDLHLATLETLRRTGIRFYHGEAIEMLRTPEPSSPTATW